MILYYYDGDEEFEYEPDSEKLSNAIVEIVGDYYSLDKDKVREMLDDLDMWDKCKEYFENKITNYFAKKAFAERRDDEKYPTDADKFGVKNNWFI